MELNYTNNKTGATETYKGVTDMPNMSDRWTTAWEEAAGEPISNERTLVLPRKATKNGAKFEQAAIEQAIIDLDIRKPVIIKLTGGRHRYGAHKMSIALGDRAPFKTGTRHHVITINTNLYPGPASETLWHELTHAAQTERFEDVATFRRAYRDQQKSVGYMRNAFEVEARDNEKRAADAPLATPVEVKPVEVKPVHPTAPEPVAIKADRVVRQTGKRVVMVDTHMILSNQICDTIGIPMSDDDLDWRGGHGRWGLICVEHGVIHLEHDVFDARYGIAKPKDWCPHCAG